MKKYTFDEVMGFLITVYVFAIVGFTGAIGAKYLMDKYAHTPIIYKSKENTVCEKLRITFKVMSDFKIPLTNADLLLYYKDYCMNPVEEGESFAAI